MKWQPPTGARSGPQASELWCGRALGSQRGPTA
jgi:hypothetical protein